MKKVLFLLLSLLTISLIAQKTLNPDGGLVLVSISGSNNVLLNETKTYTATVSSGSITSGTWTVANAQIISQNSTSATIKWTSNGSRSISYSGRNSLGQDTQGFYNVTVSAPGTPDAPPNPTVSISNCVGTIQRTGTPPSGVTWYWQGTIVGGTSTANSSATYTATNTGTYYLRARDNSSGAWSTEASVYVNLSTGGTNWYADIDGDGLGDINNVKVQCTQPVGYVSNANDNCPNEAGFSEDNGCPTAKGLSDENFIFTTAYKKALTPSQLATATVNDKVESVQYYDGLGRIKQSIAIRAGGKVTTKNNVPDDWTLNATATAFYNRNGPSTENKIVNGTTPGGTTDLLWECKNTDERYSSGSADGGWNTDYFTIDNSKTYRYSVWVKRTGNQDGTTYHGTQSVDNLSGTANGNPYFWYGDLPQLNQWYLLVGVVHPHTYRGSDTGVSGVYDINGNKVLDGTEFRWRSDNTSTRLRNYLFYTENTSVRQYFWSPLFQEINGKEFSIKDLAERSTTVTTEEQIKDIVTHYEYDDLGRQSKKYLPYTNGTNDYSLRTGDVAIATQTYYAQKYADDFTGVTTLEDINAYSETVFDGSPMNRILEVSSPGKSWKVDTTSDNDHTVKKGYDVNTATDATHKVRWFKVSLSSTYEPTLTNPSPYYYPVGSLYKIITKDENWTPTSGKLHTIEEFKNKFGQTILKRRYAKLGTTVTPHDTYYVYDIYNNLSFVIPPKVTTSDGISTTELNELCYQYTYDNYNRLVEKKLPGKGIEYIVYDKLHRPILTQDAIQRVKQIQEWLFIKYDDLGRVVYTGLYKKNGNRATIQAEADANRNEFETRGSDLYSYTNNAYPNLITADDIYTINYYDDYNYWKHGLVQPSSVYGVSTTTNLKSLKTGTKERILVDGTPKWIITITAYDDKGQVIYTASKNEYLGTTDTTQTKLDFSGKVIETSSSHVSNTTVNITDKFTYDHADRLVTHKQKVNSQAEELIVKNTYDELGTLEMKQVGNTETTPLQDIDYIYNVRGWLTNINDVDNIGTDLFTFKINYDKQEGGVQFADQYNGNISQTIWRTANTDQTKRGYSYEYDALDRITRGVMRKGDPLNVYTRHHLSLVNYDKNGNITRLQRDNNVAIMDDLTYDYATDSNKLNTVTDAIGGYNDEGFVDGNKSGNDYLYDVNGNMTKDLNKGITNITYNHLNLPTKVDFGGGKYINYFYSALGSKIKKVKIDGSSTTTTYTGGFIYENNTLKHFSTTEGYAEKEGSSFIYVYQHTDHLGNVRLNYANVGSRTAPNLQIKEESNYYPFGSKHKGYNDGISGVENDYKYNGKEYQDDEINGKALDWYDYGARNYDATLGRFMNVDPMADSPMQFDKSPFAYTWNNPVKLTDPDGMHPDFKEDPMYEDPKLSGSNEFDNRNKNFKGPGGYQPIAESAGGASDPPSTAGKTEGEVYIDPDDGTSYIWDGNNWHSDMAGGVTLDNVDVNGTSNASGVSSDSWARYIPVVGSGLDAYDSFSKGHYWTGAFHTAMAISDVFLIKSIFTGITKGGIKAFGKNYKNWSSWRSFYGKNGFAKKGQDVHHWLIEKGASSGSGLMWKLKNQMWNLKPMRSMYMNGAWHNGTIIHQAIHGNSMILKMTPIQKSIARVYQTPAWIWATPSFANYATGKQ